MGDIGRDDGQVVGLRCADDVDGAVPDAEPEEEATVTSRIFRVVLEELAGGDYGFDLARRDHPAGPAHLAHRVGQKKDPPGCRCPDLIEDAHHH